MRQVMLLLFAIWIAQGSGRRPHTTRKKGRNCFEMRISGDASPRGEGLDSERSVTRPLYGIFIKTYRRLSRNYMGRGATSWRRFPGRGSIVDMHQRRPGAVPSSIQAGEFTLFRRSKMMDVIMLAIGLGLVVVAVGYCYACARL